jgi:hypothetical protein
MKADELLDHTPIRIGKYKGHTPDKVSEVDPSYIVWSYENWSPKPCSKALYEACKVELESPDLDDDDGIDDTYERFHGDL